MIRHLFGFSGDSLTSGAVSGGASRDSSDSIASYLTDADSQLDIDGDGELSLLQTGCCSYVTYSDSLEIP